MKSLTQFIINKHRNEIRGAVNSIYIMGFINGRYVNRFIDLKEVPVEDVFNDDIEDIYNGLDEINIYADYSNIIIKRNKKTLTV